MNKKLLIVFIVTFLWGMDSSQAQDSLRMAQQETRISVLERQCSNLRQQNAVLQEKLSECEKRIDELSAQGNRQSEKVQAHLAGTDSAVASNHNRYASHLSRTDNMVKANEEKRQRSVMWGIVLLCLLATVSAVVYALLRKRMAKRECDIETLRTRVDDLNQQVVKRMDSELREIQKLVEQLTSNLPASNAAPDHSLVKQLADRITFMEVTLSRMDSSVKGYRQLTRSISNMKESLLASDYELVELLGENYIDGMKAIVTFNVDDSLEPGQRIITGVSKPQINYKGQMIQVAQITVSQNI